MGTMRCKRDCLFGGIVLAPSGVTSLQTKGGALMTLLGGYQPDYWTVYRDWPNPLQFGGFPAETWITGVDATPVIAWAPNVTCAGVMDGTHDTYLANCAATAITYGQPLYVRLMYEFNGNWQAYGTAGQPAGNSYAQFIAAWQYVVGKFRTAGVTNIKWVWNPNVDGGGAYPFNQSYPGDSWVDIVGLDGYNPDHPWQTFSNVYATSLATISGLTTLPLWICEVGCAPTDGGNTKAAWFADLFSALSGSPTISALHYFHDIGVSDYTIDSGGTDLPALVKFISSISQPPF